MVIGLINGVFTAVVGHQLVRHDARHAAASLEGFTLIISHAQPVDTPGTDVTRSDELRADLRRRHLLGADLGARHRDRAPDRAHAHALGPVHGRRRRQPARRGRGRHQGPAGHDPQLHALQHAAPASSASSRPSARLRPARPAGANERPLRGISAAVIGGTLLAGGSAPSSARCIGALVLGILQDGLIIKGVSADYLSFYPGPGDHHRDGGQHLRRPRAKGGGRG